MARENPTWSHRRIQGEPAYAIAASTVWEILHAAGIDPAPRRAGRPGSKFMTARAHAIIACDFPVVETVLFQQMYVLVSSSMDPQVAPGRSDHTHPDPWRDSGLAASPMHRHPDVDERPQRLPERVVADRHEVRGSTSRPRRRTVGESSVIERLVRVADAHAEVFGIDAPIGLPGGFVDR
jgi:hypothetical protein